MATILPFVIRPAARTAARIAARDATIIIFPGVRYEPPQADDAVGPRKAASAAQRKRRRKAN